MLTNSDILKLSKVLATKDDINDLNIRVNRVETIANSHTEAFDGLKRDVARSEVDQKMISHQLTRHESWFMLIAEKIGIKLKH